MARRALVTGATGFVGGRLAAALADRGWAVRCLVRDRSRAQGLADRGFELHEADVLDAESLRGAGEGVEIAYYLIHAMGRGTTRSGFEERERQSARNFAEMANRESVARDVYLGGLGDRPASAHLRSRHRTAEIFSALGPPTHLLPRRDDRRAGKRVLVLATGDKASILSWAALSRREASG